MNHRKKGRKLGRVRKQRRALLKSLLASLILKGKIKTTEAKAKEIKPLADKLIGIVKEAGRNKESLVVATRRLKNLVSASATSELFSEKYSQKFSQRNSGYTRIVKTEKRKTDKAAMAIIEFVE